MRGLGLIKESSPELFPNHVELMGPLPLVKFLALDPLGDILLHSEIGPLLKLVDVSVFKGGGALN